jgi:hypothetical protein
VSRAGFLVSFLSFLLVRVLCKAVMVFVVLTLTLRNTSLVHPSLQVAALYAVMPTILFLVGQLSPFFFSRLFRELIGPLRPDGLRGKGFALEQRKGCSDVRSSNDGGERRFADRSGHQRAEEQISDPISISRVKKRWTEYFPLLNFISETFDSHITERRRSEAKCMKGIRLFSMLPVATFAAKNIRIDTTGLGEAVKYLGLDGSKENIWNKYLVR